MPDKDKHIATRNMDGQRQSFASGLWIGILGKRDELLVVPRQCSQMAVSTMAAGLVCGGVLHELIVACCCQLGDTVQTLTQRTRRMPDTAAEKRIIWLFSTLLGDPAFWRRYPRRPCVYAVSKV